MQIVPSAEQQQFRDMVTRFLVDTSPTSAVRRLMVSDTGYDAGVWRRLSQELGASGLAVPEAQGGAGFGSQEVGIAMEAMGNALYCGPFFGSSVLATYALLRCADADTQARLLPGVVGGERILALAAGYKPTAVTASGTALSGTARFVVDGMAADTLLVAAQTDGATALFEVDSAAAGVTRRALTVVDPTRRLAEIHLDNATGERIGAAGEELTAALDLASIALANEMVGGAQRLLDDTLEYVKMRVQFGRRIATFQAIKHRCAELLLTVELAKSAAHYAAGLADDNVDNLTLAYHASLAKSAAADAYMLAAIEAIQLHGGIGFTAEQDTQLWYKRAKASEVLLGNPVWHRERMIQILEQQEAAA